MVAHDFDDVRGGLASGDEVIQDQQSARDGKRSRDLVLCLTFCKRELARAACSRFTPNQWRHVSDVGV